MTAALAALAWSIALAPPPAEPVLETALVFKLAVTPAAPPDRKLRYELLPPRRDRTPGNAAVDYLRAVVLLPKPPRLDADAWREREDRLDGWRHAPLDKVPVAEVKAELRGYEKALAAADRAARADRCDWQRPRPLTLGNATHETDAVPLREAMSWLRLRVKVELAEGRYDDALRSLQTAFQMAKHVGGGPTLTESLIGVALAAIASDAAGEWATAPGSPNLYWALATLPDPLIDPRDTLAGEAEVLASTLPAFREFEAGPVSEARAWELVGQTRKYIELTGDVTAWFEDLRKRKPAGATADVDQVLGGVLGFLLRDRPTEFEATVSRLAEDFAALARSPAARAWLRGRGVKDVDRMPAVQASYLAAWLRYRERHDDIAAAFLLPTPRAWEAARRAADATKRAAHEARDDPVARSLLFGVPALEKMLLSHIRTRRQVAALQAVEAVRAHLAASGGRLPRSWDEVTAVPVPDDPLTGKPFPYTLKDGVATIAAPPPAGENPTRSNNFRYELIVRPVK